MNYIYIIIFIIIIAFIFLSNKEHMNANSNNTIQNIASMYNNGTLITANAEITNNASITGNISAENVTASGNVTATNISATGNATLNNLTATSINNPNLLQASGNTITIGNNPNILSETAPDILIQNRDYVIYTSDLGGGDSINASGPTLFQSMTDAIRACKGMEGCDRVEYINYKYYPKTTNNSGWLIGSRNWPASVAFSGVVTGGVGNSILTPNSAVSYEDCYNQCVSNPNNCDYFNYNIIGGQNCNLYTNNTDNPGIVHFVKKY